MPESDLAAYKNAILQRSRAFGRSLDQVFSAFQSIPALTQIFHESEYDGKLREVQQKIREHENRKPEMHIEITKPRRRSVNDHPPIVRTNRTYPTSAPSWERRR